MKSLIRRKWLTLVAVGIVTSVLACDICPCHTPGYWKNHTDAWVDLSPGDTVSSLFVVGEPFASWTLLEALQGGGGSGVEGATQILLRAAVCAALNVEYCDIEDLSVIQDPVNDAIASGDRDEMLALAKYLDDISNGL